MIKLNHVVVLAWIVSTVLAFMLLSFERLKQFDPTGHLKGLSAIEFGQLLDREFDSDLSQTIIHFSQPECACNNASQQHVQQLNKLASEHMFKVRDVNVAQINLVPSSPSVAIIDKQGKVVYFGPYGEGLECANTKGFAITVFKNLLHGFSAELIVENAQGCYCNQKLG